MAARTTSVKQWQKKDQQLNKSRLKKEQMKEKTVQQQRYCLTDPVELVQLLLQSFRLQLLYEFNLPQQPDLSAAQSLLLTTHAALQLQADLRHTSETALHKYKLDVQNTSNYVTITLGKHQNVLYSQQSKQKHWCNFTLREHTDQSSARGTAPPLPLYSFICRLAHICSPSHEDSNNHVLTNLTKPADEVSFGCHRYRRQRPRLQVDLADRCMMTSQ